MFPNIESQPSEFSFVKTIKPLIVNGDCELEMKVDFNTFVPLTKFVANQAGQVIIDLKTILKDIFPRYRPTSGAPVLRLRIKFSQIYISGQKMTNYTESYRLIDGGILSDNIPLWLEEHYLTWQPQVVFTTLNQFQKLYYYCWHFTTITYKAYYPNGTTKTITDTIDDAAGEILIFNCAYSYINNRFKGTLPDNFHGSKDIIAYDVIVSVPERSNTYTQRYILRNTKMTDTFFVFKNSLGGFDSICFSGSVTDIVSQEPIRFINDGIESELDLNHKTIREINTGPIVSTSQRLWFDDFIKSTQKYVVDEGELKPISVDIEDVQYARYALNSYSFKYWLGEQWDFINIGRETLPEFNYTIHNSKKYECK